MKYTYPVIFEKDEDKIGATVPDLPGCFSFGEDLSDAIEMIQDAISMYLADCEDRNQNIPAPSDIKSIKTDEIVSYVLADTKKWRQQFDSRAVKKTLSIPSWLNKKAEKAGVNFSQTLQEALIEKLGE